MVVVAIYVVRGCISLLEAKFFFTVSFEVNVSGGCF